MYKLVPTILAALLLSQAHAARLFKRKYHNLVQCEGQKETDVNEAMTQSQNFADMIANKWKPGKYGSGSSNFGNGYQATMDKYMGNLIGITHELDETSTPFWAFLNIYCGMPKGKSPFAKEPTQCTGENRAFTAYVHWGFPFNWIWVYTVLCDSWWGLDTHAQRKLMNEKKPLGERNTIDQWFFTRDLIFFHNEAESPHIFQERTHWWDFGTPRINTIDTYKGYLIYTCPAVEQVVEDGNAHECQALAECYTCSAIALWMQETYGFATVPEWGEWQPGTSEYLTMFNELTGGNITDPNAFQNFGHAPYDNPADQPTSTPTTSARPAPTMPMRLLSCDYTATPTPSCMCGNSTVSVSQTVHDGSTYSYCAYETYKYPIDPPGKFVPTTLGTGSQQPVSKTSMAALPPATSNSTVSSAKCPKGNLYTDGTSCDTDCAEKGGECVPLTPVAYGQSPPVTQQITCVCP